MKRLAALFALILLCCVTSNAQQIVKTQQIKIDEKTLVKDSSGIVYPYQAWLFMMRSGDYSIKPINPQNREEGFIIYKLTEKEKHRNDSLASAHLDKLPKPNESKFFTTGKKIASFKEKDMDGNKFSLKDLTGKIAVLNFWFIGCPPCREEIPALNKIVEKYKDNPDVVFIAIALDDIYALKDFLQRHPFKYHIIDNGRYIAQGNYSISSYPTNVIVDRTGIVRFHTSGGGPLNSRWIEKTLDDLVNEKSK